MRLRAPIAIFLTCVSLFDLGCARIIVREPRSARGETPNAIRTLAPDQRFLTLSSQTVARRLRAQLDGQGMTILALSGGGADGAFGAGALVGLSHSPDRPLR
jgi:hypothetical protein